MAAEEVAPAATRWLNGHAAELWRWTAVVLPVECADLPWVRVSTLCGVSSCSAWPPPTSGTFRTRAHVFGAPDAGARSGHPLAARGLRPDAASEVADSSWARSPGGGRRLGWVTTA